MRTRILRKDAQGNFWDNKDFSICTDEANNFFTRPEGLKRARLEVHEEDPCEWDTALHAVRCRTHASNAYFHLRNGVKYRFVPHGLQEWMFQNKPVVWLTVS